MGDQVDRGHRWLHGEVRHLRDWRRMDPGGPFDAVLATAMAGVEALVVAQALAPAEADLARRRLEAAAAGEDDAPTASEELRGAAAIALEELLAQMPAGAEPPFDLQQRFEGALTVLAAAGAADALAWDARLRARAGWPSIEEELAEDHTESPMGRGTQLDLVGVHPGAPDERGGYRILLVVRFADALAVHVERPGEEGHVWPEWQLTDDAGTEYWFDGASGAEEHELVFRPGPPPGPRRLDLRLEGAPAVHFEVELP